MKIVAMCDEETAIGLKLAGFHEIYIPGDARKIFREVTSRKDVAVLFITERIAEGISKDLKEYLLQREDLPIVVEIPDKKGKLPEHVDNISMLVRRAVGVDIERRR